ncbi:hypothetical protein BC833DRAFT_606804, partial [Globomyces pollinis-pini]
MANLLQLSGAMFFCGATFIQSSLTFIQYGISFNILQDKARQTLLNFLCFASVFFFVPYYYTNQTKELPILNDVCLLAFSIAIQYGLVILFHNSIVKITNGVSKPKSFMKMINKYIIILYIFPLLPLSLIVMSIYDAQTTKLPARNSQYNTLYYKPIAIGLILCVNILAIYADYMLMNKVKKLASTVQSMSKQKSNPARLGSKSLSLDATYNIITVLVLLDVLAKVGVVMNYPVFDSIITVLSLSFRSGANLKFGTTLRNIYKPDSSEEYTTEQTRQQSVRSQVSKSVNVFPSEPSQYPPAQSFI